MKYRSLAASRCATYSYLNVRWTRPIICGFPCLGRRWGKMAPCDSRFPVACSATIPRNRRHRLWSLRPARRKTRNRSSRRACRKKSHRRRLRSSPLLPLPSNRKFGVRSRTSTIRRPREILTRSWQWPVAWPFRPRRLRPRRSVSFYCVEPPNWLPKWVRQCARCNWWIRLPRGSKSTGSERRPTCSTAWPRR